MTFIAASLFDWPGNKFLAFYAIAFVIALIWSISRRLKVNDKFAHPDARNSELTDPYEMAFLAGGTPRCAQLAVTRLLKTGSIQWKRTKVFSESRLVAIGCAYQDFNEIERTLFSSILSYGKKGMPLDSVSQLVATRISGIESRLAKAGLRPTSSEEGSRGFFIALPLIILMAIGVVKVLVGLSRDKPVLFLCIMLGVTFFVCAAVASARKKLTPEGENVLARLRDRPPVFNPEELNQNLMVSVALFGISGIPHGQMLADLDANIKKELSQIGNKSSSGCGGAAGCSSGCSSGCGGGGCGGCGGD